MKLKQHKAIKPFKLYISPYKLKFKNKNLFPSPLEGSLLAFDFGSDLIGYSDFLPWPAFGEKTLSFQLNQIKKEVFNKRFLIAKQTASLDAQARIQKKNLLFGLKIPPSHFLIEDLFNFKKEEWIVAKGFQTVKVKLKSSKIKQQIDRLKRLYTHLQNMKWRFDLNGQSWSAWKNKLHFMKEDMDFVEDPLVSNSAFEKEDRSLFAQDWLPCSGFQIKIVKPSRDSLQDLLKELAFFRWKRLVFTHSFDHPLGQTATAFWAGLFYKNYSRFFETGAFTNSQFVEMDSYPLNPKQGPDFVPPSGFGLGFADSLKKEKWKRWL